MKPKYKFIDYAFWILFIVFTNPGGIFQIVEGDSSGDSGGIGLRDVVFAMLFGCYVLVFYKAKKEAKTYKKIVKHLIIFGLYYLVIFGFFIPIIKDNPGYSTFDFIKKSRKTIYSLVSFVMVYQFYLRSSIVFFKTLVISSIIILGLFFITVLTGIEIIPTSTGNRGFVKIDRIFIASEGIMLLLIPLGVSVIVFKSRIKPIWKKLILVAFFMMFMNYFISITRRDIIGTFIYFFLASMLYNYFNNKPLIPIKKMASISLYVVIGVFIISLSFPENLEAGITGLEESVNVITEGETSNGKEDVRLGFGKEAMQNLILNNIWFGTGYDVRWRGGFHKEGYETSDYPLLSAIAMTGIFGLMVFFPIYRIVFKAVVFDIKFLKKNKVDYQSFEFCIFILFILYVVYDLIQYINWFLPVSLSRSIKWYVYLAMYIGSREIFYKSYLESKSKEH